MAITKDLLSSRKIELYEKDSEIIKYFRRNPNIACEVLLGIKLIDSQKWILQESWNKPYVLWCGSRNFGKSFLGSIFMMLKFLLFENQQIYIISNYGNQAQETFMKIEKIAENRINSLKSVKDIFKFELVTSPSCQSGFIHNPASFHCMAYNGSEIFTLNGKPDNNRGKRATTVYLEESGFSTDDLVIISEAFAMQNSDFATSTDDNFNLDTQKKKCPTQIIYASSASDITTIYFKRYKEFAKKMFLGDSRYFVADIPCEIPLNPIMDGKPYKPLLKKEQVDNAMKSNRDKALREYFNKFSVDGGEEQPIKRAMIVRNSNFDLPELFNINGKEKYVLAVDPARTYDLSVCSVMKLKYDKEIGYYGEIKNCVNFVDLTKKKKTPMLTPNQIRYFREMVNSYNGKSPDYENIDKILIDSGSGGAGYSAWADGLLSEFKDSQGVIHKGFIDKQNEYYKDYVSQYPNNSDKLDMISPKKYKTQMVEELKELLELDLIKFPREYSEKGYITIPQGEGEDKQLVEHNLTFEEEIALTNIDVMKSETVAIVGNKSSNGTITYNLPKDLENKIHDDRFYTLCLLAHRLYEIRRNDMVIRKSKSVNLLDYVKVSSTLISSNSSLYRKSTW